MEFFFFKKILKYLPYHIQVTLADFHVNETCLLSCKFKVHTVGILTFDGTTVYNMFSSYHTWVFLLPPCTLGLDGWWPSVLQTDSWPAHSRRLCLESQTHCRYNISTHSDHLAEDYTLILQKVVSAKHMVLTWSWCCGWCDSKLWPSVCEAWPRILLGPWLSADGDHSSGSAGTFVLAPGQSSPSPQTVRTSSPNWS